MHVSNMKQFLPAIRTEKIHTGTEQSLESSRRELSTFLLPFLRKILDGRV